MNSVRLPAWFASAGLALLLATCPWIDISVVSAFPVAAGQPPKLLATSQKSFEIPFTIGIAQKDVVEVVLQMSTDRGMTWQEHSRRAPAAKSFPFSCRADQEFWFAIQTINRNGQRDPTPQALKPELRIAVDTVRPKMEFQVRPDAAGRIVGIWTASDQNIDPCSMVIQYRNQNAADNEPWFKVPAQTCRTDVTTSYRDELAWWPQIAVRNLQVRAIIKDLAGNQISVDRSIEVPVVAGAPGGAVPNPLRNSAQVATRNTDGSPVLSTNYLRSRVPFALSDKVQQPATEQPQQQPPIQPVKSATPHPNQGQSNPQSKVPTHLSANSMSEVTPQPPRSRTNRFASNAMDTTKPVSQATQWQSQTNNASHNQVSQAATDSWQAPSQPNAGSMTNPPSVVTSPKNMAAVPDPIPANQPLRSVSPQPIQPNSNSVVQDPLAPTTDMPVQTAQQNQNTPTNAQWISSTTGTKKQPNPTVASVMVSGPKMESIRRSAHPSNSKRFQLEYDIDAVGPAGAKSVELWVTPDGGGSWQRMAIDKDLRSPIDAVVEREGVFGFRILVIGNDGLRARQPRNGDPADMWVNVDTTMPTVKIKAVPYGRGQDAGNLLVQWNASDANLRMRPIKLSWSPTGQAPWTTIEDGIRNEGQYAWKPAANVPDQIYLKLDVRDVAGNTATHQLNRPIDVSGLLPRGHIRGITPIRELPPSNSDTST